MAKILFVALLSVLGCALASPTCTDEEANKCLVDGDDFNFMLLEQTFPEDEGQLTRFCSKAPSRVECAIDFAEQCPNTQYANYLDALKDQQVILEELCDTSTSFREEYLEHVTCLNKKISASIRKCSDNMNMFVTDFKCYRAVQNYVDCIEESVTECGKEAVETFRTLYYPREMINTVACDGVYKYLKEKGIIA